MPRKINLLFRGFRAFSFKSWILWILDRFKLLPKGNYVFRLRNGMRFPFRAWEKYGDQGLGSLQEIFIEDRYNKHVKLAAGMAVIDVGSGMGEYLVYACGKGAKAAGFEENPERLLASRENLAMNGCRAETTLRKVISLDDIPGADFLKMDIEGGEFEVFENTRDFRKFKNIAMEFHRAPGPLEEKLNAQGFDVKTEYTSENCGYLYASRR